MDTVHIRFLRYSAFYSPLLLTMCGGHLRAEGLDATFDVSSPDKTIPDGIRSGEVHVAQSALAVSFAPCERGEPLPFRHFALMNARDGFFLARRDASSPFEWHSLEGRAVVVDHFFQPLAMFRRALRARGVDESKVRFVDAGDVAGIERAFRDGRGDFVHMQGPAPQQLELEGVAHVCASIGDVVGPVVFSTLCASPAWLSTDRARAFVRAYRRGLEHAREAPPAEIAELVAAYLPGIDRAALVRTIETYQRMGAWEHDLSIPHDLYERTVDLFTWSGHISSRPPYADVVAALPC